jgi:hypothetical protein
MPQRKLLKPKMFGVSGVVDMKHKMVLLGQPRDLQASAEARIKPAETSAG